MLKKEKYLEENLSIKQFVCLISGYVTYEQIISLDPYDGGKLIDLMTRKYSNNYKDIFHPLYLVLFKSSINAPENFAKIERSYKYPDGDIRLYKVKNILIWMVENTDFENIKELLPDWAFNYLNNHCETSPLKEDKINIRIDALPKFLQLAINFHNAVNWKGDTSENFLTPLFLEEVKKHNFSDNQIPELKTDSYGKNTLEWPSLQHDESTLSQPIFKSILKMIKPNK